MFTLLNFRTSLIGIGINPKEDLFLFDKLKTTYTESGRYYHTKQHISECLSLLHKFRGIANQPHEIEVALWFHDAIYDTHRSDNEEMSAKWAESYLSLENANPLTKKRIVDMILATKFHQSDDKDVTLLVDIDLAILGTANNIFEAYDQAIRKEYNWVSDTDYRIARIKVLRAFLARKFIYKTKQIRDKYEAQARKNINRKIKELINVKTDK